MFGLFKKKESEAEVKEPAVEATLKTEAKDENSEIAAAIAYALHKHLSEIHDYENMVMTIQKVMKPYSPWSSKIYMLRQNPRFPRYY